MESLAEDQQPLKMPRHKSITTVSVMATAVVEVPSEAAEDDEEEAAAPAPSDALEVMMAGKGEGKGMDPCMLTDGMHIDRHMYTTLCLLDRQPR